MIAHRSPPLRLNSSTLRLAAVALAGSFLGPCRSAPAFALVCCCDGAKCWVVKSISTCDVVSPPLTCFWYEPLPAAQIPSAPWWAPETPSDPSQFVGELVTADPSLTLSFWFTLDGGIMASYETSEGAFVAEVLAGSKEPAGETVLRSVVGDGSDLLTCFPQSGKIYSLGTFTGGDFGVQVERFDSVSGALLDATVTPKEIASLRFEFIPLCGSPRSGSCYEAQANPGCNDADCCTTVCAFDPFCCDVAWDAACVDAALALCPPAPTFSGGLPFLPVGSATLSALDGDIAVSGDPDGDPFGASASYGSLTSGAGTSGIEWDYAPPDAELHVSFVTGAVTDTITWRRCCPHSMALETDLDDPAWSSFDVLIFDGDTLAGVLASQSSGTVIAEPSIKAPPPKVCLQAVAYRMWWRGSGVSMSYELELAWNDGTGEGGASGPFMYSTGEGEPLVGDHIVLRPAGGAIADGPGPTEVAITATQLESFTLLTKKRPPHIVFGDALTAPFEMDGGEVTTVGVLAELRAGAESYLLAGEDLNGDGVAELHASVIEGADPQVPGEIAMLVGDVGETGLVVQPSGVFDGAFVNVGRDSGDNTGTGTDGHGGGSASWPGNGAKDVYGIVVADDVPVTYGATASLNGAIVWQQGGLPTIEPPQPFGSTPTWPTSWTLGVDEAPSVTMSFAKGTTFTPLEGDGALLIDEIRVESEGPTPQSPLSRLTIVWGDLSDLTISKVTVEPRPRPCPADLNGDGTVDGADLGILLSAWGSPGPGDLNGDGTVTGADLGLLLGAWGPCI